ncbi:type II toxin-antitoxin system Phd/YefM family antitoxin [Gilliamella sp. Pas-s27]|uniref:type II toxin-antitoxin system Phd/YefM family antitoxin n=1 Tax=Gilliamella sp. Pas-s27 TaxID=2687311 RepID=UPI0013662644|nr:type II toxin-antitoxin system prevent-host-death family antitoxin [Gilliamella sp. Pas-s27]MWP47460.1 type II toxin-antitoxin system prevent-host-death family antitoxin [Gilliamella sp. Pas-s27]
MNKYTYTNMRSELSDILDKLRSGESVIITQKGKPDVILQGSSISQINDNIHKEKNLFVDLHKTCECEKTSATSSAQSLAVSLPLNAEVIKLMQSHAFKQLRNVVELPGFKQATKTIKEIQKSKSSLSPEFLEALILTQKKHAEVIKKLEDK